MIEGRITFKRDDGRVNVSMRPTKEKALVSDGDIIMGYLLNRGVRCLIVMNLLLC